MECCFVKCRVKCVFKFVIFILVITTLWYKSMPFRFLISWSGSYAVQHEDHFWSGIICGSIWGSFAVRDHLQTRTVLVLENMSVNMRALEIKQLKIILRLFSPANTAASHSLPLLRANREEWRLRFAARNSILMTYICPESWQERWSVDRTILHN